MTIAEMIARCERLATDFVIGAEAHPRFGFVMRATWTSSDGLALAFSTPLRWNGEAMHPDSEQVHAVKLLVLRDVLAILEAA